MRKTQSRAWPPGGAGSGVAAAAGKAARVAGVSGAAGETKFVASSAGAGVTAFSIAWGDGAPDWMQWQEMAGPPPPAALADMLPQLSIGHWQGPLRPAKMAQAARGRGAKSSRFNISARPM